MTELTRRQVAALMSFGIAAELVGCSEATPHSRAEELQHNPGIRDLAILDLDAVTYGDRAELHGRTVGGARAGRVVLRDRPCYVAASPDGNCVAWNNCSAFPNPEGEGAALHVVLQTTSQSARSFAFKAGSFGGPLAVSSNGEHFAMVEGVVGRTPTCRLIVADGATGRVERDVTGRTSKFPAGDTDRLALSAKGDVLLIRSTKWFTVIDLALRDSVIFEGSGEYASLSPDGHFVAFLDEDRQVVLVDLSTRARRVLVTRSWIPLTRFPTGLGAWSPDGKYLLAGIARSGSIRLQAIEVKTRQVIDIWEIGDLGGGSFVWIKKGLLSVNLLPA